ncbi:MAG TPA: hypothetical protein VLX58_21995 [Bryobacteraceae bacterium]|nr:hypothetical protein [Bryobacteraceae bacterium]
MGPGVFALVSIAALSTWLATVNEKVAKVEPDPPYNTGAVVDVSATVIETREVPRTSPLSGVHLSVKAEGEVTDVYLGPADFLKLFEITFTKGDELRIIGSKVKFGGGHVVLAREVRKDESTLYLRDQKGVPHWTRQ